MSIQNIQNNPSMLSWLSRSLQDKVGYQYQRIRTAFKHGLSTSSMDCKNYVLLGKKEEALTWLQRGVAANFIGGFYKDEALRDLIRNDSRFADSLQQMGISQ